jgi:hypothetical protein
MDYSEYLRAADEKARLASIAEDKLREDELTALEVACKKAQSIINNIIEPELREMKDAILNSKKKCNLDITRRNFVSIQAEYQIEIKLESSGYYLRFEAVPEEKIFKVSVHAPKLHSSPATDTFLYSGVTSEMVKKQCADFFRWTF